MHAIDSKYCLIARIYQLIKQLEITTFHVHRISVCECNPITAENMFARRSNTSIFVNKGMVNWSKVLGKDKVALAQTGNEYMRHCLPEGVLDKYPELNLTW